MVSNAATESRLRDLTDGILELEMMLEDDSWREWFIGNPHEHLRAMMMELAELKQAMDAYS
jgi:hypothetical protein